MMNRPYRPAVYCGVMSQAYGACGTFDLGYKKRPYRPGVPLGIDSTQGKLGNDFTQGKVAP